MPMPVADECQWPLNDAGVDASADGFRVPMHVSANHASAIDASADASVN